MSEFYLQAFPASNLVRGASKPSDERKQWLCSSPDEKFAHVILTYEKPFVISSLEIKNNGSAYVQVEGGNTNEDSCRFKVLFGYSTCWLCQVFNSIYEAQIFSGVMEDADSYDS